MTAAKKTTSQVLQGPCGPIPYTLARKKVRNLNLRVRRDGSVSVSAPVHMPDRDIELFLLQKAQWILQHQEAVQAQSPDGPPSHSKEECLALFTPISDRIFPLFYDLLGGQKPQLKVRDMRSRWGSCHVQKRVITLSTRLADKPLPAVEYVILHEYVHFLHPHHQRPFHEEMARLMPDYQQRRKLLR